MKLLDTYDKNILDLQNARRFLSDNDYNKFISIAEEQREIQLMDLLMKPIEDFFSVVNEVYFRSKWAQFVNNVYGSNPIILLEVASGDADMIPQSISISNPRSTYIAFNMNQLLNKSLINKTKDLKLNFQLIDDDAAKINDYIAKETVDVIAFQHGVNDVLQAILCDKYGVDTINSDWMNILPEMIKILQKETLENTFENTVKEPFLNMIKNVLLTLKKDGIIAINHYMFQLDLDWGYPKNLYENIIPLIRNWFNDESSLTEVFYDGFDEQWWIFLKKSLI